MAKDAPSFNAVTSKVKEGHMAKNTINKMIAKFSKKHLPKIILDGPSRETTKTLMARGHKASTIFIPNSNKDDFTAIRRHHKNTFYISLEQFLLTQRTSKQKCGGMYLDYMSTFDGGDYCNPRKDLTIIFNNKMLAPNAPICVTFSNPRRKKTTIFSWTDITKVITFIYQLGNSNGYQMELLEDGGPYKNGGQMFSFMFIAHKR